MQLIPLEKFNIKTCFIQFLWFFRLKCWFKGQMISRIHLCLPKAYKLIHFDRNINGNGDVKFFELDYWSLHWRKNLALSTFIIFHILGKILTKIGYALCLAVWIIEIGYQVLTSIINKRLCDSKVINYRRTCQAGWSMFWLPTLILADFALQTQKSEFPKTLKIHKFLHESRKIMNSPKECPICLETFNPESQLLSTPCDHIYHSECINDWMATGSSTCPKCRSR